MSIYNTLNVKLSNSGLNKLKSVIKNGTKMTLNLHQLCLIILMMILVFHLNFY